MTEPVTYAYAVARDAAGLSEVLADLHGVARTPVHLVRAGEGDDVVAAVSAVPSQDFCEDALRAHLEDLDWLESVARAHHGVVEALAEHTTVLPLRLATVYLDDDRVRSMLNARREAFADRLSRLDSHVEWGVKIYVAPQQGQDDAQPAAAPPDLSPGRAYLRHRRAQQHSREDTYRAAERAAERIHAVARGRAVDRVRHRIQQGELAHEEGQNIANDAYLVPLEHAEDFRAQVLHAAEGLPGVRVEVTGPWAPYSFATPPQPEAAEQGTP
ncbi:GvpL/GvpF family gas vesicle protein [Streptomyces sp. SYSU K21746]